MHSTIVWPGKAQFLFLALCSLFPGRLQGESWIVTNLTDEGSNCLRQVISQASSGAILQIQANGVLVLAQGELIIDRDLTLEGPGAEALTLSGNQADRVFHVKSSAHLRLRNLTVSQGSHPMGGAVFNEQGRLEISGCIFQENRALGMDGIDGLGQTGTGGWGGAVYNLGFLTISNSWFADNLALGGKGGDGAVITNASISYNSKIHIGGAGGSASGGAIFNGGNLLSIIAHSPIIRPRAQKVAKADNLSPICREVETVAMDMAAPSIPEGLPV